MEMLEKFFGKRLFQWIVGFLIAILLIFAKNQDTITPRQIGYFLLVISTLGIIYEGKLRYYVKFAKNTKKFKSKKEEFIANYLDKKRIKYVYEQELKIGSETLHPDFFLPEFDVYVEYWGLWSNDFEYRKACNHKRKLYKKYEYKLVELYPDNTISFNRLDWKFTERLLKILKEDRNK